MSKQKQQTYNRVGMEIFWYATDSTKMCELSHIVYLLFSKIVIFLYCYAFDV